MIWFRINKMISPNYVIWKAIKHCWLSVNFNVNALAWIFVWRFNAYQLTERFIWIWIWKLLLKLTVFCFVFYLCSYFWLFDYLIISQREWRSEGVAEPVRRKAMQPLWKTKNQKVKMRTTKCLYSTGLVDPGWT